MRSGRRTALIAAAAATLATGAIAAVVIAQPDPEPGGVLDAGVNGYEVYLDGYPDVMTAGQVYDGTVLVDFPDDVPEEDRGGGQVSARATIGVLGRGVPEDATDGEELPALVLCSSGVLDADEEAMRVFDCQLKAPPTPGVFTVAVRVVPMATGEVFQTTRAFTVTR